jgi:hypothetical protein
MVWPTTFEPPPPKGPPPKIPLPKPPTQAQMRNIAVSPMSQPPATEYFNNINYSPSTPSRVPPRNNIRPPTLHRLSETDSYEEADSFEPPAPPFSRTDSDSPVSPYTIVDYGTTPGPNDFELDMAAQKGSESSAGTLSSVQSNSRSRTRSTLPYLDDEEPPPFVLRGDKHKRILGIDQKTSHIKRSNEKKDHSNSVPSAPRREKTFPSEIQDRSGSPLPAPDVVPFLYQDIEVCSICIHTDLLRMCEDSLQSRLLSILTPSLPLCPLLNLTFHRLQISGIDTVVQT